LVPNQVAENQAQFQFSFYLIKEPTRLTEKVGQIKEIISAVLP
jgi:hypothetical protein